MWLPKEGFSVRLLPGNYHGKTRNPGAATAFDVRESSELANHFLCRLQTRNQILLIVRGLQNICQGKKLGERWWGRRNFQALHPFIYPSSREISKHYSKHLAGIQYPSLLPEVVLTVPLNEEQVFPESLQDSYSKAQTCSWCHQSSRRENWSLESLYTGWRIARLTLDRLVMFYQKTDKAFGRENTDWRVRAYKSWDHGRARRLDD